MPWSYRKSVKIGPMRVNFSKRGVGYSVGSKWWRVGKTATGRTYRSHSFGGLRFTKTLNPAPRRHRQSAPLYIPPTIPPPYPQYPPPAYVAPQQPASSRGRTLVVVASVVFVLWAAGQLRTSNRSVSPTANPATVTLAAAATGNAIALAALTPTSTLAPTMPPLTATPYYTPIGGYLIPVRVAPTPTPLGFMPSTVTFAPTATPAHRVVSATGAVVNVRVAASTSAPIVAALLPDAVAVIVKEGVPSVDGGPVWHLITVAGQAGYVRSDLVKDATP